MKNRTPLMSGSRWLARWEMLAPRERRLVRLAGLLVLAALTVQLALLPPWRVLARAPAQQASLDAELMRMQGMQSQAKTLQAMAVMDAPTQRRAIEGLLKPLGSSVDLTVQGDRLTIQLRSVPAAALTQLLQTAPQLARAQVLEARLRINAAKAWDGALVFQLSSP